MLFSQFRGFSIAHHRREISSYGLSPLVLMFTLRRYGRGRRARRGEPWRGYPALTIAEAARMLSVKEPAIRKRIQRGTLEHDKGEDGRTYVYLDAGVDTSIPASSTSQEERIAELKDQIDYLRGQLAEERDARRRADTIIAQLTQADATLAGRVPELEALSESSESPETDSEEADKGAAAPPAKGERRSWWRRLFGP